MKLIITLFFSFLVHAATAQKNALPSEKFSIEGKVKNALSFSIADLDTFRTKSLPDVVITNHLGEKKHTLTNLKGILLKDILSKAELDAENPKVLSEFYFVFVATDNYKIVFSWNEIFNTETGNNIYIIMEEGGKKIRDIDGRISLIVPTDFKTGRRHMSNIDKIIVERAK
jgi:hypothetical protein